MWISAVALLAACSTAKPTRLDVTKIPESGTLEATPAAAIPSSPDVAGRDAGAPAAVTPLASQVRTVASPPMDPPGERRIEPDGNDDPEDPGQGPLPAWGHFEKVGRPSVSLRQICDLTPLGDGLYAAHALSPLGADGATISRYRAGDAQRPFTVAFDWNRPGQPAKGGGAGQGFLRVRAIGGRLYVPDADPPYNGFGLVDWGTEGYVFVSRPDGSFARAVRPNYRPPGRPSIDGQSGASVLPRAYHVFDVIRFRGRLIASTGAVPPKERAWYGPSPGALHVATADLARFEYGIAYPVPYQDGVWRLTYLVRFRDRLYAGIQDYDAKSPHDYVVVEPPADAVELQQEYLRPVRVTRAGAAQTIRWYADRSRLYWIAWERDGVRLRVTDDGDHWELVQLPEDAGAPTDLVRFRGSLVLLTEWGLYRIEGCRAEPIARVTEKKSPFELRDLLCAAPLAVFQGELYAGGQRDGSLYRLAEDATAARQ